MRAVRLALLIAALAGFAATPATAAAARPQDVTWHGTQIHLYDAEAAGRNGVGVTVAVIDSWVDTSHPDFQGRARGAVSCLGGTCRAGQQRDACAHGTHVAGTVGSTSYGVARKVTILPVQVLSADAKGECTGAPGDVAAGIRYATAHGADILNLSLGPEVTVPGAANAVPAAVHAAAAAGLVVVFSAGNNVDSSSQSYGPDALVVAATGPSGALATYSQRGKGVSVAAPGGQPGSGDSCSQRNCVTSLYPGGQYAVAAGTSMAAPHVSGLAALLLGEQPDRGRASVLQRILGTAHPLAGAGAGLIDARAALDVSVAASRPAVRAPAPLASKPPVRRLIPKPPARPVPARTMAPAAPTPAAPRRASARPAPTATTAPAEIPSPLPRAPQALPVQPAQGVPLPLATGAAALAALCAAGVFAAPRLSVR